jgi:glycosyltransferase involved in cell wall biosynthesis
VAYHSYAMSRRANPGQDLRTFWQLVRILRDVRPDLVHTFDTKPSVWGRIAARLAGVPVVVGTLPGLGSLYTTGWGDWKTRLIRAVYQPLQTVACHLSDLTIFQNEEDVAEFGRRRVVPRGRAAVIPGSGVRTKVFQPVIGEQPAIRAELGLATDTVVVTMVSRIMRSKGVLEYATAAREVRRAQPGVECLLVGPIDSDSLDALTAPELEDVQRSVRWLGRRSDVRRILAATDVFVLPSYYREGIPRVLLEAAAMGLPLVAADSPGSKDVVQDGVNGYLVPPQDSAMLARKVLALVGAPALRRRFGEASRRRAVEEFDLSVIAERTRAAYARLLDRERRTGAAR